MDTTDDTTHRTLPEKKYHQFLYTISLSCSSQIGFGSADEAGSFALVLTLDVLKGQYSSWLLANDHAEPFPTRPLPWISVGNLLVQSPEC